MSALNLANAYYWNGDFDKAKTVLDHAVINGNKQATLIMDTQFDMVNFNILVAQSDFESCEMLISRMEKRIYDNQSKPKLVSVLNEFAANMKAGYALTRGEYDEYISLEAQLPPPKSPLNYVSRQYNLAKCYEQLGSSSMAVTYLENTLSRPGNLFIQKNAKENLHKLKGEK